jgi:hypothetical protein
MYRMTFTVAFTVGLTPGFWTPLPKPRFLQNVLPSYRYSLVIFVYSSLSIRPYLFVPIYSSQIGGERPHKEATCQLGKFRVPLSFFKFSHSTPRSSHSTPRSSHSTPRSSHSTRLRGAPASRVRSGCSSRVGSRVARAFFVCFCLPGSLFCLRCRFWGVVFRMWGLVLGRLGVVHN